MERMTITRGGEKPVDAQRTRPYLSCSKYFAGGRDGRGGQLEAVKKTEKPQVV